jgi:hypothetical protein
MSVEKVDVVDGQDEWLLPRPRQQVATDKGQEIDPIDLRHVERKEMSKGPERKRTRRFGSRHGFHVTPWDQAECLANQPGLAHSGLTGNERASLRLIMNNVSHESELFVPADDRPGLDVIHFHHP